VSDRGDAGIGPGGDGLYDPAMSDKELQTLTELLRQLTDVQTQLDTYQDAEIIGAEGLGVPIDRQAMMWEMTKVTSVMCGGLFAAVRTIARHLGAAMP
jgi:hypothetical protein